MMNRLTPASPPGAPPRFPSGWRARLGRDPVPILLREGSPGRWPRVRRDLIDDDEAPGQDEIVTYPEVKAFLKKQEKTGAFPVKPPEKTLGSAKFGRAIATLRALERMAEFGLRKAHPAVSRAAEILFASQSDDGGIGDFALGETPESRPKLPAVHFQGWALGVLCRVGYDDDPRVERGFRFLLANRQADGGWAWRGVRTDSAARPSSHLVTGMALRAFAASPTRRTSREARRAAELLATRFLQPGSLSGSQGSQLTGNSSASRASTPTCSTRWTASPRSGSGKRTPAFAPLRRTCGAARTPMGSGTRRARAPRRQAGRALDRQGAGACPLAHRTGSHRPAPRELGAPAGRTASSG